MNNDQKPVHVELQELRAELVLAEREIYLWKRRIAALRLRIMSRVGSKKKTRVPVVAETPLPPSKEFSRFLWGARATLAISLLCMATGTASYIKRGEGFEAVICGTCSVMLVVLSVLMRGIHKANEEELKAMKQISDRTS